MCQNPLVSNILAQPLGNVKPTSAPLSPQFTNSPCPIFNSSAQKVKWRSYTFNEESHIHASEKEAQLLIRNPNASNYWLAGTLSIRANLSPDEHKRHYKVFANAIRQHDLILYWVREFDGDYGDWWDDCHLHYHFIILRTLPYKEKEHIRKLIKKSLPEIIRPICELYLEEIDNVVNYSRYILKAKAKNNETNDKHKGKRRLFPKVKMKKIGFIGKFWAKNKKDIWQEVIDEMKKRTVMLA